VSTCRITFAESAIADLEGVREWYTSQAVPEVGDRLVREIFAAVEQLAQFPESGRVVPEFDSPSLRELVHPPFRLVYRLDAGCVRVVRVWRSERLMGESGSD
jgi:plasmid stabilization system protein ParE